MTSRSKNDVDNWKNITNYQNCVRKKVLEEHSLFQIVI
jgi:hypothetical protein